MEAFDQDDKRHGSTLWVRRSSKREERRPSALLWAGIKRRLYHIGRGLKLCLAKQKIAFSSNYVDDNKDSSRNFP